MKALFYPLIVISIVLITCSCNKQPGEKIKVEPIKPTVVRDTSFQTLYTDVAYMERTILPLFIRQQVFNTGQKCFSYGYKKDSVRSVLCFTDNTVTYNKEDIKLLGTRKIKFQGRTVKVHKYYYSTKYALYVSNVFANDSIGLILERAEGQRTVVREYDVRYELLHQDILNDSVFFHFER